MEKSVDAILFDIDGTLVDSTRAVERTWRRWAAKRGIEPEPILAVCHGRRSEDTIADFLPAKDVGAATAELERFEIDDLDDIVALPGAHITLEALPPLRWGAVTSGSRTLMAARMTAAGLRTPKVLVAAEDVVDGKPDPEGYRKAAELLGFDIRRCLVIEDAPAGIEAGRRAGATVIAVTTTHDRHAVARADFIISDLSRLHIAHSVNRLVVRT